MAADIIELRQRKADRRSETAEDMTLELIARNGDTKRFAIRVENGVRRIARLIVEDRPLDAYHELAAMHQDALGVLRGLPDDGGAA